MNIKNFQILFHKIFKNKFLSRKNNFNLNLEIDTSKIKNFLELKYIQNKKGFIWNGNWDIKKKKISLYKNYNINYKSIIQIYKDKIFYKESDEYKYKFKQIKKGIKTPRGKTINQLNKYFSSINKLQKSLKKHGYISQAKLKNKNLSDEIGVVIGRYGEIIKIQDKFGGTHRFALCKILKIKKIIINIKAIHSNFIKKKTFNKCNKEQIKKIIEKKLNNS